MIEQIKAPEKELSDEIANLADEEFETLVIRMFTELVEYGCKIEEKVKDMQSEITRTQINYLEQKEEINIQPEQNE